MWAKVISGKEGILGSRPLTYRASNKSKPGAKGRALLSYLKNPIKEEIEGVNTAQFSNNGAARSWAHVLSALGYDVDVINWDDVKFKPRKQYDLVVYHGGKNFSNIQKAIKAAKVSVYYSTGSYWQFHNKAEEGRFKDFEKRNGVSLSYDRHIDDNEQEANVVADAIISLGNSSTKATYGKFTDVYSLEGASFFDDRFSHFKKNYVVARNNFLFLSGPGNIHKGLDLVLEAFRSLPGIHLHIVTMLDKDFEAFYHKDLYEGKNIHTYGYIPQRSDDFYKILDRCAFSILPSCSEGSPGSVIESMQQGLIPLVSKESHIDLPQRSMYLADCRISTIKKTVKKLAASPPVEVGTRGKLCFDYVSSNLTVSLFEDRLSKIVKEIAAAKK